MVDVAPVDARGDRGVADGGRVVGGHARSGAAADRLTVGGHARSGAAADRLTMSFLKQIVMLTHACGRILAP